MSGEELIAVISPTLRQPGPDRRRAGQYVVEQPDAMADQFVPSLKGMAIASDSHAERVMDQDDAPHFASVRLTRKFAEAIDGVDLSKNRVGDRLELSSRDARMLIAEGWAMPVAPGAPPPPASSDDRHLTRGGGSRARRS